MKHFLACLVLIALSPVVFADNGIFSKKSAHSVSVTIDRLENLLKKKGITIVTRLSHDDSAKRVGIPLRPTELLIFGNPKLGSHFLTSNQTAGIDLPLKALAWEDENGQVWLSYNDPNYIAFRHNIHDRVEIKEKIFFCAECFNLCSD